MISIEQLAASGGRCSLRYFPRSSPSSGACFGCAAHLCSPRTAPLAIEPPCSHASPHCSPHRSTHPEFGQPLDLSLFLTSACKTPHRRAIHFLHAESRSPPVHPENCHGRSEMLPWKATRVEGPGAMASGLVYYPALRLRVFCQSSCASSASGHPLSLSLSVAAACRISSSHHRCGRPPGRSVRGTVG
jgi:hypothetical protein